MKAILVIDEMPKSCHNCPCAYEWTNSCIATNKAVIDFSKVQEWCPLKPMPKKKFPSGSEFFNDYVNGYNDCIDEVLK